VRCPPRTLGPLPPIACAYARVSKSKEGGRRCLDTRLTHASTHVAFKHVAFSHPYTRLYIHPHGHTHTHTLSLSHTYIHTHFTHAFTHAFTYTQAYVHTHARARAHTHTHMHTHKCTHKCTHTGLDAGGKCRGGNWEQAELDQVPVLGTRQCLSVFTIYKKYGALVHSLYTTCLLLTVYNLSDPPISAPSRVPCSCAHAFSHTRTMHAGARAHTRTHARTHVHARKHSCPRSPRVGEGRA